MKSSALLLISLVACVERSFPQGLPCEGPEQRCPPDQACMSVGGEMLCFSEGRDAGSVTGCDPLEQVCDTDMGCYWRSEAEGGPTCAAEGEGGPHAPCSGDEDCRAGFGCVETLVTRECAAYCDVESDEDCGSPLDECFPLDGRVGSCEFAGCDPLAQNCAPSEACYLEPSVETGLCNMQPGDATQGESCAINPDCARDFHCVQCGGDPRCGRYCDRRNGDADCADIGAPCVSIGPDSGNIGVCGPCV